MKPDAVTREYLLFMIDRKEIKGKSWKNRKANKFYEYLRQDAKRYNVSIFQVLKRNAYFVMRGEIIHLKQ